MKKALAILALIAGNAMAQPFLVCDPYPANTDATQVVQSFTITGIGTSPITTPAVLNADGTQSLHYDLSSLGNGSVTVTVAATNQWGTGAASVPFSFTKAVVGAPSHVKISQN